MTEAQNKGYILKKEKGSGEFEDLYLEGVELLQQLAGAHWTDFNEHDPGVTILENIAYTLTNLTFKANRPIKDILTESKGRELVSGDNGFFIPSEIYTTNPVTIEDYRKLFFDQIKNVKNVWLKIQGVPQSPVLKNIQQRNMKGLYHVLVEMFDYDTDPEELNKEKKRIVKEVGQLFHSHRNLCEDLYDVVIFDAYRLRMKLELTLDDHANGEEVFGEIYFEVSDYLAHEIKMYSLWELQSQEVPVDDIFNGPKLENGFIPNDELKERKNVIVLSEITKLIANVPGVTSVDSFHLEHVEIEFFGSKLVSLDKDKMILPDNTSPILELPSSNKDLVFKNQGVTFSPDLRLVQKRISYKEAMSFGSFRSVSQSMNTVTIPKGKSLNIASYYSIREQFPIVYGIGKFGLQEKLPAIRYAQANQLKAFLLPFDQLMANFLSQLTHIYTLYDVNDTKVQSYFYQELHDMPDLVDLIKKHKHEPESQALKRWGKTLYELNKQFDQNALLRLNQVADNLLARFAERFPTYALKKININCYGQQLTDASFDRNQLSWKRALISNYDQLSYNRAKGYNYKEAVDILDDFEVNDENNKLTPGIIQKTGILLGIQDYRIRSLSKVIKDSGEKIYQKRDGLELITERLEIIYSKDKINVVAVDDIVIIDETVANLRDAFYYVGNSGTILEDVLKYGVHIDNYEIKHTTSKKQNSFYIMFKRENANPTVVHIADSEEEANKAINFAIDFFVRLNQKSEGVYPIEHLLLAPRFQGSFFGFSFTLPGNNNSFTKFEQAELKPSEERNSDVNIIMENLTEEGLSDKGPLQLRVVRIEDKFAVRILNNDGDPIAITAKRFSDEISAQDEIEAVKGQLCDFEPGQLASDVNYYAYYGDRKVNERFFSFTMSYILPSWPVRFQDENFRTQFNNIIFENAPAHIAFGSYWLDLQEMEKFEECFYDWFKVTSDIASEEVKMARAYELITKISTYRRKMTE